MDRNFIVTQQFVIRSCFCKRQMILWDLEGKIKATFFPPFDAYFDVPQRSFCNMHHFRRLLTNGSIQIAIKSIVNCNANIEFYRSDVKERSLVFFFNPNTQKKNTNQLFTVLPFAFQF